MTRPDVGGAISARKPNKPLDNERSLEAELAFPSALSCGALTQSPGRRSSACAWVSSKAARASCISQPGLCYSHSDNRAKGYISIGEVRAQCRTWQRYQVKATTAC